MAMLIVQQQWLHVQVFTNLNFASLTFVFVVMPFKEATQNWLTVFNEAMGLAISYFLLPLQNQAFDPEAKYSNGQWIVYILYLSAYFNLTVIILLGLREAYKKAKRYYKKRCSSKSAQAAASSEKYEQKSEEQSEEAKQAQHFTRYSFAGQGLDAIAEAEEDAEGEPSEKSQISGTQVKVKSRGRPTRSSRQQTRQKKHLLNDSTTRHTIPY